MPYANNPLPAIFLPGPPPGETDLRPIGRRKIKLAKSARIISSAVAGSRIIMSVKTGLPVYQELPKSP